MKKVDFNKLQAGDLVEVPRTQFAPMRRGWQFCKGQCRLWAGAVDVLEQKAGVA